MYKTVKTPKTARTVKTIKTVQTVWGADTLNFAYALP